MTIEKIRKCYAKWFQIVQKHHIALPLGANILDPETRRTYRLGSTAKEKLIAELESIVAQQSTGAMLEPDGHSAADQALLDFINDPRVNAAFENIQRWYS